MLAEHYPTTYCVVQPEIISTLGILFDEAEAELKEINRMNAPSENILKLLFEDKSLEFPLLKKLSITDCKQLRFVSVKMMSDLASVSIIDCGCLETVQISASWGNVVIYPWLSLEGRRAAASSWNHYARPYFEEKNVMGSSPSAHDIFTRYGCLVSNQDLQNAEQNAFKCRKIKGL